MLQADCFFVKSLRTLRNHETLPARSDGQRAQVSPKAFTPQRSRSSHAQ